MKIKVEKTDVKTLFPGDAGFYISSAFTVVPRASFTINPGCPNSYKQVIAECIERKWLVPVAHVPSKELFWQQMGE